MPRKFSRLAWGNNFRRLPSLIQSQLEAIEGRQFVVGCAKALGETELSSGLYRHLEIESIGDLSSKGVVLLPSSTVGRTSYYNCTVEERKNRSIGKITKLIRGKAPNWKGSGFHKVQRRQEVWPTTLVTPSLSYIEIQQIGGTNEPLTASVRFQVLEVLNKEMPGFQRELLRCVNLLQENAGKAELFEVDASGAEYVRRISENIGWEILPNSKNKKLVDIVVQKLGRRDPRIKRRAQERLEAILSLKPLHQIQGSRGFAGYFAAQFTDTLTVFENLEIDHALYIMRGPWQEVSKLTRSDVRTKYSSQHERIVHNKGWEKHLARIVKQARGEVWDDS